MLLQPLQLNRQLRSICIVRLHGASSPMMVCNVAQTRDTLLFKDANTALQQGREQIYTNIIDTFSIEILTDHMKGDNLIAQR